MKHSLSVVCLVLLVCLSACKDDVSSVYSSKNRVQCGFNVVSYAELVKEVETKEA